MRFVCAALGGGEDAFGHIDWSRTQPADCTAADQEEPGTQTHILLYMTENNITNNL